VVTAFHVFIIGVYHKIAKVMTDTSYDAIFYDLAADQGHYVDEFTVLSEMAMQIGRLIALGAVATMVMFISLNWTFVIGAVASLALTSLSIVMAEERGIWVRCFFAYLHVTIYLYAYVIRHSHITTIKYNALL
jgi:hypothetical protein